MLSTTWPRISSFPQASDFIFYPFCHRINTESKQYDSSKLLPKLEKTLESPLDCKEIQPVHSKGDHPWGFFGSTDAKAETPILWPPHVKSWLIGKDSDAGRDFGAWGKGDNRGWDGWMASLTRWTWVGDRQGGLACCSSWGRKESDVTEGLNGTELKLPLFIMFSPLYLYSLLFLLQPLGRK